MIVWIHVLFHLYVCIDWTWFVCKCFICWQYWWVFIQIRSNKMSAVFATNCLISAINCLISANHWSHHHHKHIHEWKVRARRRRTATPTTTPVPSSSSTSKSWIPANNVHDLHLVCVRTHHHHVHHRLIHTFLWQLFSEVKTRAALGPKIWMSCSSSWSHSWYLWSRGSDFSRRKWSHWPIGVTLRIETNDRHINRYFIC